jgi:hypothetical protein
MPLGQFRGMHRKVDVGLVGLAGVLTACGHNTPVEPGGGPPSGPAAQVWITTADQTHLLSQQPDVQIRSSGASPVTIDVDEAMSYQEMV